MSLKQNKMIFSNKGMNDHIVGSDSRERIGLRASTPMLVEVGGGSGGGEKPQR